MKKIIFLSWILVGCIGEDVNPDQAEVQIMNSVSALKVLQLHQFEYTFSVAFEIEPESITWESSDESVLVINEFGTAAATSTPGSVTLTATATYQGLIVTDELVIEVSTYEPKVRITNPLVSLGNGTNYQLDYVFTNEFSQQANVDAINWSSSDESIFQVNSSGLLTGISEGSAELTLEINYGASTFSSTLEIAVSTSTVIVSQSRFGSISPNSGATIAGDFELMLNESNDLVIQFGDNYEADASLTDLYIYLSNNPGSLLNALEVSKVNIYNGSHQYIVDDTGLLEYDYVVFANKSDQTILGIGEALDEVISETKQGTLGSTSSYTLAGDFVLTKDGNNLNLSFADNYRADTSLPGLYVYLSNNPNSIASAFEIASVTTFTGAHDYTIPNAGLNDYVFVLYFCKPFNVKVGHGQILD